MVADLKKRSRKGMLILKEMDVLTVYMTKAVSLAISGRLDLNAGSSDWLKEKGKYCRVSPLISFFVVSALMDLVLKDKTSKLSFTSSDAMKLAVHRSKSIVTVDSTPLRKVFYDFYT
jgi:hypothetical protein